MKSTVVILSPIRTGTTKLAYILQTVFGISLLNKYDKFKYPYESKSIRNLNTRILGSRLAEKEVIQWDNLQLTNNLKIVIQKQLARYSGIKSMWGWKEPRTCFTIHVIHSFLRNPKYIIIQRDIKSTTRSAIKLGLKRHSERKYTFKFLYDRIVSMYSSVDAFKLRLQPELFLELSFENLYKNKVLCGIELEKLCLFLKLPSERILEAIKVIDFDRVNL